MKTNELRIGNFFLDGFRNQHQMTQKDFMCLDIECWFAISITEEWLLKFGFKKSCDMYEIKDFIFSIQFENKVPELYCEFYGGDKYEKQILYVHQLQNLYFALIGEELTIN